MVDNSILRKVKACLARSESSNPNEAAIALRQAHALMQKHSINVDSVEEMLNMVDMTLFHAATYNSAKNNIGGNSYYLGR